MANPALESEVLDACRDMLARDIYPSLSRLMEVLARQNHHYIWLARKALVERGELVVELKPNTFVNRRPRSVGERPVPKREAIAAQLRKEHLAARAKEGREIPAIRGTSALDVVSSPSLRDLPPAAATRILVRRTKHLFPSWRTAHA